MPPGTLADILLISHFLYVVGLFFPIPLIFLGSLFGWSWPRNSYFRNIHLGMVLLLVVQTIMGWTCPVTDWEESLRVAAGQPIYGSSFVAYWVERLLYHQFSPLTFAIIYFSLGLATFLLYALYPPNWIRRRKNN